MNNTSNRRNLSLAAKVLLLGLMLCNVDVSTGATGADNVQPVFSVQTTIGDQMPENHPCIDTFNRVSARQQPRITTNWPVSYELGFRANGLQ